MSIGQGSGTDAAGQKKSFEEQFDWQLDHTVSPPRWVGGLAGKRSGAYFPITSTLVGADEALDVNVVQSVDPATVPTAGDPQKVTVATTTTVVVAADTARLGIILTNDSDQVIYLGIGAAAVMNEGHRLNANGGFLTIFPAPLAINAICLSGSKNLSFNTFT